MEKYTSYTVFDCDKEGHCYHPGTAVGSLVCCRCGKYLAPLFPLVTPVTFPKVEKS